MEGGPGRAELGRRAGSLRGGGGRRACGETVKKEQKVQGLLQDLGLCDGGSVVCTAGTSGACGPCEPPGSRRCRGRPPQPAGWPLSARPGPWGSRSPAPVWPSAGSQDTNRYVLNTTVPQENTVLKQSSHPLTSEMFEPLGRVNLKSSNSLLLIWKSHLKSSRNPRPTSLKGYRKHEKVFFWVLKFDAN